MNITIKTQTQRKDNDAIRSWGLKHGFVVASQGPIAWEVQKAFHAAHEQAMRLASEDFLADAARWPTRETAS